MKLIKNIVIGILLGVSTSMLADIIGIESFSLSWWSFIVLTNLVLIISINTLINWFNNN